MSSVATFPQAPAIPAAVRAARPSTARRGGWRKWVGAVLIVTLLGPATLSLPPVWHGALRVFLTRQATRAGYELTVGRMTGGPFGMTQLEAVRLRGTNRKESGGTDVIVSSARFAIAWRFPWLHHPAPSMREIDLAGVHGTLDLTPASPAVESVQRRIGNLATWWLPENFGLQADDFRLSRGSYSLHATGLLISGRCDGPGEIAAREVHAAGPGTASLFNDWHGQTAWKGNRLTLTGLDLGDGIGLANATLDASQLGRRRLDWDCSVDALGGQVRGQGAVDFSRERMTLEVATTLRHTALAPLARMFGLRGPVDGLIEQASFTFRGDPDNLSSAQMWLSARATGFRWGERRWESLDTQAMVVNRRVQLHRFDLRQNGNSLSVSGEFPLPPDGVAGLVWTGKGSWWQRAGFSCRVDARLEDLRALADLVGPGMPELAGRTSINGRLSATPGHAEIEGYLNVEGTRLTICGAPLDFLRSTLLFRGGAMEIADVQATHDADYFTAHGIVGLSGERGDRHGEARAEIRDMSVYVPALLGVPGIGERAASVRHLDAILRLENGELIFDRWDGEQADRLLSGTPPLQTARDDGSSPFPSATTR